VQRISSNEGAVAENPDAIVYQLIGEGGFERLTAAFYRRVATDDILRPMYPAGDAALEEARLRLREFFVYRFGGPARYIAARGHPRLRARHMPFQVDRAARDRWVKLMEESLAETRLPTDAESVLRQFFENTATFLINRGGESPDGGGGAGFAGNPHFPVREK
jgi:hemoglobin